MRKLLLSLFLLSAIIPAWSCAYSDEYYYGGHLFGGELLSDSLYEVYYNLEPYCDECFDRGSKANLMEWKQKLGTPATLEEIAAIVYEKSLSDLRESYNMSSPKNEFERALFKNRDFVEYLLFAKRVEPLCQLEYEEWGDAPQRSPGDISALNSAIDSLVQMIPTVKDAWLRQRYVMQLVRLSHYATRYADAISFYDKYVESSFEKNSTYYRTLAYKAGSYRRNKELIKSKFTFAQIFDQSPDYRHLAYKNFKYIDLDGEDWQELIDLKKSPSEQACIWLMQEVYMGNLDLNNLRQLYQNDPGSIRLEVVALRQFNRMEESIFLPSRVVDVPLDSTKLTYGEESTWEFGNAAPQEEEGWWSRFWKAIANFFRRLFGAEEVASSEVPVMGAKFGYYGSNEEAKNVKNSKTVKEAIKILDDILKGDKVQNRPLFHLLNAYALMHTEDFGKAQEQLDEAKKSSSSAIQEQAAYLEVLLTVWKNEEVTSEVQTAVLDWLKKADKKENDYSNADLRKNLLLAELGRKYLVTKQYDKAVLVLNYSNEYNSAAGALLDWYYSDGDIVRMAEWVKEGPDDGLSKYMAAKFYNEAQLVDIRATKLLRKGKFKESSELYATLPDTFKFGTCEITSSFVNMPIMRQPSLTAYTRKTFAEEAAKRMESGKADQYMEIANAISFSNYWCYNDQIWGCGGLLSALSDYEGAAYPFNIPGFAEDFHNRYMAFAAQYTTDYLQVKYYKKAAGIYADKEQKAKALFCAINGYPYKGVSFYHKKLNASQDSIYAALHGDLSSTQFVKDMMVSCPDFAAYKK